MTSGEAPAEPEQTERVDWGDKNWVVLPRESSVRSCRVLDGSAQVTLWTDRPKGRRKLVGWHAGCAMPSPPKLGVRSGWPISVYRSVEGEAESLEEAQAAAEAAAAGVVDQVREAAGRLTWIQS